MDRGQRLSVHFEDQHGAVVHCLLEREATADEYRWVARAVRVWRGGLEASASVCMRMEIRTVTSCQGRAYYSKALWVCGCWEYAPVRILTVPGDVAGCRCDPQGR